MPLQNPIRNTVACPSVPGVGAVLAVASVVTSTLDATNRRKRSLTEDGSYDYIKSLENILMAVDKVRVGSEL